MSPAAHSFGGRLRTLRRQRGLSQQAVADRSGIGRTRIIAYEQGRVANPTLDVLRRLARALGVPVMELLRGVR